MFGDMKTQYGRFYDAYGSDPGAFETIWRLFAPVSSTHAVVGRRRYTTLQRRERR